MKTAAKLKKEYDRDFRTECSVAVFNSHLAKASNIAVEKGCGENFYFLKFEDSSALYIYPDVYRFSSVSKHK